MRTIKKRGGNMSVGFGAGASFGRDLYKGGAKPVGVFLLAGALRSGINEGLEELGHPDDGVNFVPGVFFYGWKNVTDIVTLGGNVLDQIEDAPSPNP